MGLPLCHSLFTAYPGTMPLIRDTVTDKQADNVMQHTEVLIDPFSCPLPLKLNLFTCGLNV